jgi:hypothetical protein
MQAERKLLKLQKLVMYLLKISIVIKYNKDTATSYTNLRYISVTSSEVLYCGLFLISVIEPLLCYQ